MAFRWGTDNGMLLIAYTLPPIQLLHSIYQLDYTFYFVILRAKFRNWAMLLDETVNEVSDNNIGFNAFTAVFKATQYTTILI